MIFSTECLEMYKNVKETRSRERLCFCLTVQIIVCNEIVLIALMAQKHWSLSHARVLSYSFYFALFFSHLPKGANYRDFRFKNPLIRFICITRINFIKLPGSGFLAVYLLNYSYSYLSQGENVNLSCGSFVIGKLQNFAFTLSRVHNISSWMLMKLTLLVSFFTIWSLHSMHICMNAYNAFINKSNQFITLG